MRVRPQASRYVPKKTRQQFRDGLYVLYVLFMPFNGETSITFPRRDKSMLELETEHLSFRCLFSRNPPSRKLVTRVFSMREFRPVGAGSGVVYRAWSQLLPWLQCEEEIVREMQRCSREALV